VIVARTDLTPSTEVGRALTLLTDDDLYLFNEGSHLRLYDKLGAHPTTVGDVEGTYFAVWAPNADHVSVVGDENGWERGADPLRPRGTSGIWEGFVPDFRHASAYKFHIGTKAGGYKVDKADPFAFHAETPPRTGSKVWSLDHTWNDAAWMSSRAAHNSLEAPISIYELHLGSWRRGEDGVRWLSYRELAESLPAYIAELGFTHVELLPITEHPFYGSWGYQATGFFAPTSRYGTPQDLMTLIDAFHQAGIGVILDWVPSHFPNDEHGLGYFDGTHLYEHADTRQGFHPDWHSLIFNYGRAEVCSFLLSSAMFWLDHYHIDGLRVDAVASMLYLDYSRKAGEWIPNRFGGNENLEAIDFLRRFNQEVYAAHPGVQTLAEESTAWPMVSRPTYVGGLGFGMKWDMGWMHDTLLVMSKEPIHRRYHHNELTFRTVYASSENFCLPLSHDEVVHGKGSLLSKMPGDDWQKFANLRLLLGYQFVSPGKKLLFMGAEIGQRREWAHEGSLDWDLLDQPEHAGLRAWVTALAGAYRDEPALHELDCHPDGFEWIDCTDWESSILVSLRRARTSADLLVVVCNFTPVVRHGYRVGAPRGGWWRELLNSDAEEFGGSGQGNLGGKEAEPTPYHGREFSLELTVPPLGVVILKSEDGELTAGEAG